MGQKAQVGQLMVVFIILFRSKVGCRHPNVTSRKQSHQQYSFICTRCKRKVGTCHEFFFKKLINNITAHHSLSTANKYFVQSNTCISKIHQFRSRIVRQINVVLQKNYESTCTTFYSSNAEQLLPFKLFYKMSQNNFLHHTTILVFKTQNLISVQHHV